MQATKQPDINYKHRNGVMVGTWRIAPRHALMICIALTAATSTAMARKLSSGATSPQAMDPIFQQMLALQNKHRADHGAPALTWSDKLAADALDYTQKCINQHSDTDNGENIYVTTARNDSPSILEAAVEKWYGELTNPGYDFSKPGNSPNTGHFTQLVWVDTTQVGCAIVDCPALQKFSAGSGTLVICQYSPPGNWQGMYADNVLPLGTKPPVPTPSPSPDKPPSPSPNPGNPSSSPSPKPQPGGGKINVDPDAALKVGQQLKSSSGKATNQSCILAPNQSQRVCVLRTGELQTQSFNQGSWSWVKSWSNNVKVAVKRGPFTLAVQSNGNVAVTDKNGRRVWQTNTANRGPTPATLGILDTGNLVLVDANSKCIWASQGCP